MLECLKHQTNLPGVKFGFSFGGFCPKEYLGVASMTAFAARSTSYSPGAGVLKSVLSLGRLRKLAAGGVAFPFIPNPVTSYCAGPGPIESKLLRCFWPKVNAGAPGFFESGTFLPSAIMKRNIIHFTIFSCSSYRLKWVVAHTLVPD